MGSEDVLDDFVDVMPNNMENLIEEEHPNWVRADVEEDDI